MTDCEDYNNGHNKDMKEYNCLCASHSGRMHILLSGVEGNTVLGFDYVELQ